MRRVVGRLDGRDARRREGGAVRAHGADYRDGGADFDPAVIYSYLHIAIDFCSENLASV